MLFVMFMGRMGECLFTLATVCLLTVHSERDRALVKWSGPSEEVPNDAELRHGTRDGVKGGHVAVTATSS